MQRVLHLLSGIIAWLAVCGGLRGQCLEWVNITPELTSPGLRAHHDMVYDSARGCLVLFGGTRDGNASSPKTPFLGDTWEWNGAKWIERETPVAPSPRTEHVMFYHAQMGVTVLFGGRLESGEFSNETWTWNGTQWSLHGSDGPSARRGAAVAYDSTRKLGVLHGGLGPIGELLSDTWEWNGQSWTYRGSFPAASRANHAMAFDPKRDRTVLVGGWGLPGYSSTHEWDGVTWIERPSAGIGGLGGHTMAFDPYLQRVVIHGDDDYWNSMFVQVPGVGWSQLFPTGDVTERASFGLAVNPATGTMLAYGGYGSGFKSDLSEFDSKSMTWTTRGGSSPPALGWKGLGVFDAARNQFVLVNLNPTDRQTWLWDGVSWRLAAQGTGPWDGSAAVVGLAFDPVRCVTVAVATVPSGLNQKRMTWEWDGQKWEAVEETLFAYGHGPMTFHAGMQKVVAIDWGRTDCWDGSEWTKFAEHGPKEATSAVAYDAGRDVLVAFGGEDDEGYPTSLAWEFADSQWKPIWANPRPPSRSNTAMAYDPTRAWTVIYGGTGLKKVVPAETWAWDGAAWTNLNLDAPGVRTGGSAAYDPANRQIFLYGGKDANFDDLNDLWVLRNPTRFLDHPNSWNIPIGGQAQMSVEALNVVSYSWQKDGHTIVDGPHYSGASTSMLTIIDAGLAEAGTYHAVITDPCEHEILSNPALLMVGSNTTIDTGFEPPAHEGTFFGEPLAGQQGWYNPGNGPPFLVFDHAANNRGIPPNPMGDAQFAAGRREGPGLTARAAHETDLSGHDRWAFVGDVAARFDGAFPAQPDLGTMILYPDLSARGVRTLLAWDDTSVCDTFSITFEGYDASGQRVEFDPGPAFAALSADRWYRIALGVDYATNRIWWVQIRDLHAGPRQTFFKTGWYMLGGTTPQGDRADVIWLAASGGTGAVSGEGNIVAWDNVAVRHDLTCEADCEIDNDLDLFDFLCFQQKFVEKDPYADFEGDEDWDLFDYLAFQGAFANGCG